MGHVTEWRPAVTGDLAQLNLSLSRRNLARALTQISDYPSFALLLDGQPVAIVTLAPAPFDRLEMALMVHGRLQATPGRIAALRQIVVKAAGMLPSMDAIMRISDHNPAGQKIARSATFRPLEEFLNGTSVRTWLRPAPLPAKTDTRNPALGFAANQPDGD
jgi:hypothetical protein